MAIVGGALVAVMASELRADTLEEIRVTAKRHGADTSEVVAATTVVARDAIDDATLLTDALAHGVGVSLQQTTPGQGAAIIRGLKGSSLLHTVDGIRMNNAIFRSAPTPYFAFVPAIAARRIEVVRGTSAALYGSEAVGGVVNFVSHLPHFDWQSPTFSGRASLHLDTAQKLRSFGASIDAGTAELAASISAARTETGDRRTGGGDRIGPSGYTANEFRGVIVGTPDDARRWYIDTQFVEQPDTPRIDELVAGFGQDRPASSEFRFAPAGRRFVHARYERQSGPLGDWQFDVAWQRIDDDRVSRDFEAQERRHEQNRSEMFVLNTSVSGGTDVRWIAGLDTSFDEVHSARQAENLLSGQRQSVEARFPNGAKLRQLAAFGQVSRPIRERHSLSAGLRWSRVDIELPDAPPIAVARASGDLGWLFDLRPRWQLAANLGAGFRAPNIFDLGTLGERPGNRFNVPSSSLDAETVLQTDIGLRYQGESLNLELVGFALDYRNRITSAETGEVTSDGRRIVQSVNAAESRVHGIEVGAEWQANDRLRVGLTLNYSRGEQRDAELREAADRVPPLNARLFLDHDVGNSWRFRAWANTAARQDRLSARDRRDPRIDPLGTPGWAAAGADLSWSDDRGWRVRIGIDNLFDRRYRNHGSGIDAAGRNLSLRIDRNW